MATNSVSQTDTYFVLQHIGSVG